MPMATCCAATRWTRRSSSTTSRRPGRCSGARLGNGTFENFEFDAAGHMTAMGATQLEFDARGRLTRATKPDGTIVEMVYDYRGARVAKRVTGSPGTTTRYVDELDEEHAGVGTGYVFAERTTRRPAARGRRAPPPPDHRGSVVLVTRPDGGSTGAAGSARTAARSDDRRRTARVSWPG